jgi:MerR family transcriptional regulator/heat shock protein HspR
MEIKRAHDPRKAVFVISVAAELAGVHPQTLRIYERKGLVDPGRTTGGSRRYSETDIERVRRIQDLTAAGLNLEGVRRVIELEDQVRRLEGELEQARREVLDAIEQTRRQYRREIVPLSMSPVVYGPGPGGRRR